MSTSPLPEVHPYTPAGAASPDEPSPQAATTAKASCAAAAVMSQQEHASALRELSASKAHELRAAVARAQAELGAERDGAVEVLARYKTRVWALEEAAGREERALFEQGRAHAAALRHLESRWSLRLQAAEAGAARREAAAEAAAVEAAAAAAHAAQVAQAAEAARAQAAMQQHASELAALRQRCELDHGVVPSHAEHRGAPRIVEAREVLGVRHSARDVHATRRSVRRDEAIERRVADVVADVHPPFPRGVHRARAHEDIAAPERRIDHRDRVAVAATADGDDSVLWCIAAWCARRRRGYRRCGCATAAAVHVARARQLVRNTVCHVERLTEAHDCGISVDEDLIHVPTHDSGGTGRAVRFEAAHEVVAN